MSMLRLMLAANSSQASLIFLGDVCLARSLYGRSAVDTWLSAGCSCFAREGQLRGCHNGECSRVVEERRLRSSGLSGRPFFVASLTICQIFRGLLITR